MVSRVNLTGIIKPRAEEILEMARDRLNASPFAATFTSTPSCLAVSASFI